MTRELSNFHVAYQWTDFISTDNITISNEPLYCDEDSPKENGCFFPEYDEHVRYKRARRAVVRDILKIAAHKAERKRDTWNASIFGHYLEENDFENFAGLGYIGFPCEIRGVPKQEYMAQLIRNYLKRGELEARLWFD